jgi:tRNA pseudouridine32 synthase/23S rRNA pseudouridine746 synthase
MRSAEPQALELHHVDDTLIIVHKPAGLLSVPGRGPDKQDCLITRLQQLFSDALVVHRLDMSTSGLMVFARSLAAQRALGDAFAQRQVHKRYIAIVQGHVNVPLHSWQHIDFPIYAEWSQRPLRMVDAERGQPSQTRWQLLEIDPAAGTSRVELEPLTGRTHQLRVHMQALGHPIVGDALYAPADVAAASPRLLLHACSLGFTHPATAQPVDFCCPAPF